MSHEPKLYVGVTDRDWYDFLRDRPDLDEVNFWQPGGNRVFGVLAPGEPFLFKLKAPDNAIAGVGFFAHATRLPVSMAWDAFGEKNGAADFGQMFERIRRLRHGGRVTPGDHIGCVILRDVEFWDQELWIDVPKSFSKPIVSGKSYRLAGPDGATLWREVQSRLGARPAATSVVGEERPMYGDPRWARQRLGQGTFRVQIIDLYGRRCAVTFEKALPVLQAAHIKPVSLGGQHDLKNGLLLRSDVHRLFDEGYVTVDPDYQFKVSDSLREKFDDGATYRPFREHPIWTPADSDLQPDRDLLEWHNAEVFQG